MFQFLALITNKKYWSVHSLVIKLILMIYGIKVGKSFYIEGTPQLKIRGNPKNIVIGNNVKILGDIDIRNRENGKVIVEDDVYFDRDVRLVAARDAVLKIGKNSRIGGYTIFNAGADMTLGQSNLISGFCVFSSSDHKNAKDEIIISQGYEHGPVEFCDDVWIGAHVVIGKDVKVGKGAVVGGNAVVTKNIPEYAIAVGVPAKVIKSRK